MKAQGQGYGVFEEMIGLEKACSIQIILWKLGRREISLLSCRNLRVCHVLEHAGNNGGRGQVLPSGGGAAGPVPRMFRVSICVTNPPMDAVAAPA